MVVAGEHREQLKLLKSRVRRARPKPASAPASVLPVARVALDVPLAHLDRPFDYLVPESMHEQAVPGCRVKVRFSGRNVDGYLLERREHSDHAGALASLRSVVSPEPVLSPEVLEVSRLVADRYAGTLADVLRLAIPPRHARVEAEDSPYLEVTAGVPVSLATLQAPWRRLDGGTALVERLGRGERRRAVCTDPPGTPWPAQLAAAAAATLMTGGGSVLCVPDARDVSQVATALEPLVGADGFVTLTAELGPAARYRAFLAVARGQVRIVVGTRSAALAPVRDLALVAIWDDGDDLFAEPRAPYPHAREVLLLRSYLCGAAVLVAGYARSVEAQALVESGWAVGLQATRAAVRRFAPQVHITGESDLELADDPTGRASRMPRRVFETVRAALETGPVLVHAPRSGYQPALACASCRHPARCRGCTGPLRRLAGAGPPSCRWCGLVAYPWSCPHCDGGNLRAPVVGALRTAEEWGRSFPHTTVVSSGGDHVLDVVDRSRAIVIATPGAEPRVDGGYAAAVILDTWLTLGRESLRTNEEAMRRWLNIVALVRPAADGGRVVAVGEPSSPVLQSLVRVDPEGFAARELADRAEARLTPAARMASITVPEGAVSDVLASLQLPPQAETLGPVPLADGGQRLVVRIDRRRGAALSRALSQLQAARSARKLPPVRVQVDPSELG
jgi:primosomal protein N' (replication factor Y) (superfamily II helicase)